MALLPRFTAEESLWFEYRAGYIEIDSDAPEEIRKSILEKAKKYRLRTDKSQVPKVILGESGYPHVTEADRETLSD